MLYLQLILLGLASAANAFAMFGIPKYNLFIGTLVAAFVPFFTAMIVLIFVNEQKKRDKHD